MKVRRSAFALFPAAIAAVTVLGAASTGAAFRDSHRPILFERFVGPNFTSQMATVDPGGREIRTLTRFKAGAREGQWSPNGGRIVFARQHRGAPGDLFTMRPDGEQLRRVSHGCHGQCLEDFEPSWSNDGREIVFSRAFGPIVDDAAAEIDLMLVNRNGTDVRVLERFGNLNKRPLEPHNADFSPDDSRLAFTLVDLSTRELKSALFIYDMATGERHRLTPWRLNAGNADWSADGSRILFNSNYFAPGASDVYTIGSDGSGLRRLTHAAPKRTAFAPTWSPSNRRIAFTVASKHVQPHTVVMNVGGENRHRVTPASKPGVVLDWG